MAAQLIDGNRIAQPYLDNIAEQTRKHGKHPGLKSIIIGDNENSRKYTQIKAKTAQQVGINFTSKAFPAAFDPGKIIEHIQQLNDDKTVAGIILQLPLPEQYLRSRFLKKIHPFKDADCMHPKNLGLLLEGSPFLLSPVLLAVLAIINFTQRYPVRDFSTNFETLSIPVLRDVKVTIVGAGFLVGRPLAVFLMNIGATVTIVNQFTSKIKTYTIPADIIITGTDQKNVLTPNQIRDGTLVIDVGNDLDADQFQQRDIILSSHPGGIGPVSVAFLLRNTLLLAT